MIQKAECKSSDASSSWQTMLRGCLTVHAFLFFEPLPSAPVQHKHTHTRRAAHACWKWTWWACFDLFHWWMCLWLPFHLILPLHTPFLCVVISESTCRQYLLGDVLINHWSNVHARTQTRTQQCFLMADQTPAKTHTLSHTCTQTHPYGCILRLVVAKATAVHHLSF